MRHPEKPTEQQNSATSGTVSKAHMTGGGGGHRLNFISTQKSKLKMKSVVGGQRPNKHLSNKVLVSRIF